jgi:glycosyltransferase involved in cell wall biosynthesis
VIEKFFNKRKHNSQFGGKNVYRDKKINKKNYPLISIITVVYNNSAHIQKTLNSIYNQKYKNFEIIVVDGGSNDNTLNIIKKNDNKINFWISESDRGIYDAFNKGMQLCNGDYLGFVNSDDILKPNALKILVKYIRKNPKADFFFGAVKKHWGVLYGYKPWKIYFSWGFYSSHSTGFFIKKNSAEKVGNYNLKYKYSADYDYFFRMIVKKRMKGIATKKEELFGIFNRGGFSSRVKFIDHFKEEIKIRNDNGQSKIILALIIIYKVIKNYRRLTS